MQEKIVGEKREHKGGQISPSCPLASGLHKHAHGHENHWKQYSSAFRLSLHWIGLFSPNAHKIQKTSAEEEASSEKLWL